MNNDLEAVCVESMKRIVAIHGEQPELIDISEERISEAFGKIAEEQIRISGSNSGKVKHLLYNFYNLRPEFREDFEAVVFKKWYEAFQVIAGDRVGFAGDLEAEKKSEAGEPVEDENFELTVSEAEASVVQEAEPEMETAERETFISQETEQRTERKSGLVQETETAMEPQNPEPQAPDIPEPQGPDIMEEVPSHREEMDQPMSIEPRDADAEREESAETGFEPETVPDPEAVSAVARESETPEEEAITPSGQKEVVQKPEISGQEADTPSGQEEKTLAPSLKSKAVSTGFKRRKEDLFDRFLSAVSVLMRRFTPKY